MSHLTIREAAHLIARTPATIRRYIRSGRLAAAKEEGKFGEEYKIRREDLLALGFAPAPTECRTDLVLSAAQVPAERSASTEPMIPVSIFNDLLMKHEQMLVQYGMIRAGGQKLLEYKAEAEAKDEALKRADERYRALRARAVKEIRFLRKHLREAEIEVEDRNIEIVLLQDKVKRLEKAAADVASIDSFDQKVVEIRQKERAIAKLEAAEPDSQVFGPAVPWAESYPPGERGEDN
jgi:excisionase family DNA binding protein